MPSTIPALERSVVCGNRTYLQPGGEDEGEDDRGRVKYFQVYRDAGFHWREGQPLYDGTGTGFIYLPQCAMLCVPLSFMSFYWGGVVWRILNIWRVCGRRLACCPACRPQRVARHVCVGQSGSLPC